MKLIKNVIFQYSIATFVVIAIISYSLGARLATQALNLQINKHIDLYPEIINQEVTRYRDVVTFFDEGSYTTTPETFDTFIANLKSFGKIFRVKIWGKDGYILYNDDETLMGKAFPENPLYRKAWQGQIQYEVAVPSSQEQASEMNHRQVLEIYVPFTYKGRVLGIVEVYEGTDDLFLEMEGSIRTVWTTVIAAGFTIYIALFLIFYGAHSRLKKVNRDLQKNEEVTILTLAAVAETRDNETGAHLMRTRRYIQTLCKSLSAHPGYAPLLTPTFIQLVTKSCVLHDIGKVGVPDSILLKPGKLTPDEFETIKLHTHHGYKALQIAKDQLGTSSYLELAREIAYCHHEKWDGSGYPRGLVGTEIPLSARLMAIADVYDALISERVYKPAFTHEVARGIIIEGKGSHFDPELVNAFLAVEAEFIAIAEEYRD